MGPSSKRKPSLWELLNLHCLYYFSEWTEHELHLHNGKKLIRREISGFLQSNLPLEAIETVAHEAQGLALPSRPLASEFFQSRNECINLRSIETWYLPIKGWVIGRSYNIVLHFFMFLQLFVPIVLFDACSCTMACLWSLSDSDNWHWSIMVWFAAQVNGRQIVTHTD